MTEWRFIDSGMQTAEFNMRFDMDLAEQLQRNEILPTVRVYGWKPWAVSLGYNQSRDDVDTGKCTQHGLDIVRRPTGGRAILHANEVTYSIVMFAEGRGITEIYSIISRALVTGLSEICPSVAYETSQPNFRHVYRQQESIPCFSSSARYEVQIDGKKLVGSAQRRFSSPVGEEVVLQHGSILLGPEHKMLGEVVRTQNRAVTERVRLDLDEKTTDLSTALNRPVSYEEVAAVLRSGFERAMNIQFISMSETVL